MSLQAPSRRKAIMHALGQIIGAAGAVVNGQPARFTYTKYYAPPAAEEASEYGFPILEIQRGQMVGYSPDGDIISNDLAHGMGLTSQPVTDFVCATFHPYDQVNPPYDDCDDDAELMRTAVQALPQLPLTVTVQPTPSPSLTQFAVDPGYGRYLSVNEYLTVAGQAYPLLSVVGDLVTLSTALLTPFTPGVQASQITCYNSYPYDVYPDYAQISDGTPFCVGYMIVRAYEDLRAPYP